MLAQANVGVVSNVKVLSDKVPDVSSLEAWKAAYIKPGMTDQEKAIACWKTVVQHQHQTSPPREFIHHEDDVQDFLKLANVYGHSYCSVAAAEVMCLARSLGLPARGWTVTGHCLSEVQYGGKWHLFDASLINYFPKPDGDVASIHEVVDSIKEWYEKNPDFKLKQEGDKAKNLKEYNDRLYKFGREEEGWGFKRGPALLAGCPFYSIRGWWPSGTHGWYSTMQEFDGRVLNAYESGYSQGYRVNVQLRPGERLTRNWSNKGLYANMDGTGGKPGCLDTKIGEGDLKHLPGFGDLAPGRVGNGKLEYDVPLLGVNGPTTFIAFENLQGYAARLGVEPRDPLIGVTGKGPSVLILRMPSSYLYLTGELLVGTNIAPGGSVTVSFSDNNGLDWKEVQKITATGDVKIDLSKLVLRRYDYRLKFEMTGDGTGLHELKLTHDVQHSQRPLPALAEGPNTITFSADPPEGTIIIEGSTYAANKGRALVVGDFHPVIDGFAEAQLLLNKNEGSITFPVETPGAMTRIRFGCFAQMTNPNAGLDLDVSFDGGTTWKPALKGNYEGRFAGLWTTCSDVPPATRKALVRYTARGSGNTSIANLRIDADYREPAGGFRPVKVTYLWSEDGVDKTDVHVARTVKETYTITCAKKPLMKSLVMELAE